MVSRAVGLNETGGVTQGAQGMVQNADSRVAAARALQSASEATSGGIIGPAGDTMRAAMFANSGATGVAGARSSEVAQSYALGERAVVQGTNESTQQQTLSASEGESTYSSLNREITS